MTAVEDVVLANAVLDPAPTLIRISVDPGDDAPVERLVAAARQAGRAVLVARGGPVERELPLAVVAQLLRGLPALAAGTREAVLRGDADGPGLTEVLAAADRGPLLVVVRDAQWLDAASSEWLRGLARRMPGRPILLALSGSDGDGLRSVWAPTGVRWIEVHLRASDQVVDDRRAGRLLAGLSGPVLAVLRGAAAADGLLDLPTLALLTGADSVSETELRSAIAASGLTSSPSRPRIVAEAVRHRLLAGMSVAERGALHAAVAERAYVLAQDDMVIGRVLLGAPPVGAAWARTVLAQGGRSAARRGEHELAMRLLHRALAEPGPDDAETLRLTVDLAAAEVRVDPRSSDHRLAEVLRAGVGPSRQVRVRAADLLLARGSAPLVRTALAESAEHWYDPADPLAQTLRGLFWQADFLHAGPADADRADVPDLAEPVTDAAQAGVLALRLAMAGIERDRCVRLARFALAAPDPHALLPVMPRLAACRALGFANEDTEAEAGFDRLLIVAQRQGALAAQARALAFRADMALRGARLDTAEQDMARARAVLPYELWHPRAWPYPIGVEICLHLMCGRQSAARELAQAPVPAGARSGAKWSVLLYARALFALNDGELEAARDLFLDAAAHLRAHGERHPMIVPWRSLLAETYRMLGERERGLFLLAEERELNTRWDARAEFAQADLDLAALGEPGDGPVANALAMVSALRVSPAKLNYAHALVQLAGTLLDQDPAHEVSDLLNEAESILQPYPCHRLRAQIKRLDERRGRPRAETVAAQAESAWPELSPAEQRVVALAVRGHANGEIAELCSITKRTVEVHLTRAYRKLGISGRAELVERVPAG